MTGSPLHLWILCLVGYLAGSVPSGVIISKLAGVDDITSRGSGNIGATNVLRVLGPKYAICVLCLDIIKGALPAYLALDKSGLGKAGALAAGACAIAGHNWSVFLKFRGGKGVATTAGVAAVVFPELLCVGLIAFVITVAVSRYVSLGSLVGIWTAFAYSLFPGFGSLERWAALGLAAVVSYRHKSNIQRLISGNESKISFRRKGETG